MTITTAAAPPAPAEESGPLAALVAAVDALVGQDPTELAPEQALAEARVVLTQVARLRVVQLRRLADVSLRELHNLDGAPTAGTWLDQQRVDVPRSELALAKKLHRTPRLTDAVTDGLLALSAAGQVGQALDRLRRHVDRSDGLIGEHAAEPVLLAVVVDGVGGLIAEARGGLADDDPALHALRTELATIAFAPSTAIDRLEGAFLVLARELEPGQLRGALDQLVDALLPNELEDRAERGHRDRGLVLTPDPDGSGWTITRGQLDLETGELLWTVLQAERATDPDNPVDTAAHAEGRAYDEAHDAAREAGTGCEGDVPRDPRSQPQRDHDALRLGLRRLLDSGVLGLRDKVAPHLGVTVGLDALHGAPGALPARATSGLVLPTSLVLRWACDSAITRFVLGLGRRVFETSHTERTLKAHERRALRVQWGGQCAAAGCRTTRGLVPHHPEAWAQTRLTSYDDSIPFCEQDHHHLHVGGQVIRLKDGRYLGPDGWARGPGG